MPQTVNRKSTTTTAPRSSTAGAAKKSTGAAATKGGAAKRPVSARTNTAGAAKTIPKKAIIGNKLSGGGTVETMRSVDKILTVLIANSDHSMWEFTDMGKNTNLDVYLKEKKNRNPGVFRRCTDKESK